MFAGKVKHDLLSHLRLPGPSMPGSICRRPAGDAGEGLRPTDSVSSFAEE